MSASSDTGFEQAVRNVKSVGESMPSLLSSGLTDEKKIQQAVKTATTMWQSNVQCLSHIISLKQELKDSKAEAEAIEMNLPLMRMKKRLDMKQKLQS